MAISLHGYHILGEKECLLQLKPAWFREGFRNSILIPERVDRAELLDLGVGTAADVSENLAQMQRINDWFGGTRALLMHLLPRLALHTGPVTLLDLGCGIAGIPSALVKWGRRRNQDVHVYGLDHSLRNLQAAGTAPAGIQFIQADARHLPFSPGCVDYVISSLFIHHLPPADLVHVLHQSYRMARCGLIMSDLVRGWLPWAAYHLIQPLFGRNYLTRNDGLLSILRAYTPSELANLANTALGGQDMEKEGFSPPLVYQHWPWRMTLVVDK